MSGPNPRVETAELEAGAWHSRLGEHPVTTEMIEEFFAWRAEPKNAEAYRRVEKAWAATGKIANTQTARDAVDAALSRRASKSRQAMTPLRWMGVGILAAAAVLAVVIAPWAQGGSILSTHVGEQRLVQLVDGSTVRLDTDTRIKVRYARDERIIDLQRGQALFTVASDHARPFIVVADDTRVRAVGTVFDVRRTGKDVSVTLVEGVVEVEGGRDKLQSSPERMTAGQQRRRSDGRISTATVDIEAATSWADGRIVLRNTPLEVAVSEVNRYLTDKIVLDAPRLRAVGVNGVFRTGDRDAFVSTAAEVLDLDVVPGADGAVRLTERNNN